MEKDYYKILGVSKTATEDEIRKAFLKLSKRYHPDVQTGKSDKEKKEAEEKFKEINEAHEVLSDKSKREQYDNFGTTGGFQSGFGPGGIDPREFFRKASQFGGFSGHFGGFSNAFRGGFGFGDDDSEDNFNFNPNAPKNGRSVRISANFDLEDLLYGAKKEFTVNIEDPCPHCYGTGAEGGEQEKCPVCGGTGMETKVNGMMIMQTTCRNCHGSGMVSKKKCPHCNNGRVKNERKLSIDIPQGIDVGDSIRIKGEGEKGVRGGQNGDLCITVGLNQHDIFKRDGRDLAETVYISSITASLGGSIDVQTPWGTAKLNIPKDTESGKWFKIQGQGIHSTKGNGDLFVDVEIEPFVDLTQEQKKILKEFEKTIKDSNLKNSSLLKEKCKKFQKKMKK